MSIVTKPISNFDPKNTNLILIDNGCKLELNSCFNILKNEFAETYMVYNNTLIEKTLLINHLPLEETKDGFKMNASSLEWDYVAKFSQCILITDSMSMSSWTHDKYIDSIFYRIITGKSMVLILNGELNNLEKCYPYFSKIYTTHKNVKFIFNEMNQIDDIDEFEKSLEKE